MKRNAKFMRLIPQLKTSTFLSLSFFVFFILAGCKSLMEEPFTIADCPIITSTSPLDSAIIVDERVQVTAKFNKDLAPTSVNAQTFTLAMGETAVEGTVSYVDSVARFTPSQVLAPNLKYTATVHNGIKDLANNYMIGSRSWSFTTQVPKVVIYPTVTSIDPGNAAVSVPVNRRVAAIFNVPMNTASITTATFRLQTGSNIIPGAIESHDDYTTFIPSVDLDYSKLYIVTVSKDVQSAEGVNMLADYYWTFTTAAQGEVVVPPGGNPSGPALGSISGFGAFGGNAGITNQGTNTLIQGNIGTTAASTLITGFHDGTATFTETPLNIGNVTGRIYTAPPSPGDASTFAIAQAAANDAQTAFNSISPGSKPGGTDPGAGELGGLTLRPGIYKASGGSFSITSGNLVLDAAGDANATWIFQASSSLTVGIAGASGARSINLINGASANNVFWYVGSAATINGAGGGTMVGTILASAGVTFSTAGNTTQTVLNGRAIGINASVTMVNTTITVPQ